MEKTWKNEWAIRATLYDEMIRQGGEGEPFKEGKGWRYGRLGDIEYWVLSKGTAYEAVPFEIEIEIM